MRSQEFIINGATYTVYENGDVYGKQKKIIQRTNIDGYLTFTAGKKGNRMSVRTHRLVAKAFVPNPNGYPEVDHKDANRENAAASNLEWVSHQENVNRAHKKGHYAGRIQGEKNPKAKLKEEQVRDLRELYEYGYTIRDLHKQFGIPESTIGNIVHRHTWKDVE